MMMKKLILAGAVLCLPLFSHAAEQNSVATISDAGGTVMVDRGKGFVSSKVGENLFQNDRVITLDGSMAEITYTDGCRTKLKSNNLIVISIDPGCKAAILDATRHATQVAGGTHPFSPVVPVVGVAIMIPGISIATDGFGN